MASVTAIRTRLTVCPSCGHRGRLIIATGDEVISRCHACGDEMRSARSAAVQVPEPVAADRRPAAAALTA
jgi:uncharacterized protein (DUF983 family)